MASTTALCDQCNSSGLPIMPVRYTVVPKAVALALPAWAGGDRVTSVALGSEFKYALRTLREGYVYIFYEKNMRGAKQWECYSVGQDGCMKLQLTPQAATAQGTPTFQCSRNGHSNTRVQYIVIEQPKKCGVTWIAFSHHKWSDDILKAYTADASLRSKRMQTIDPAALAGGAKHGHGAIAGPGALEGVLEYAPGFSEADLPFGGSVPELTKEDGSLRDPARLSRMSTRYPWHLRPGDAQATADSMKKRGEPPSGQPNSPQVLALWDGIGIAHELNGYRNDAAGWIKKYGDERELQISAINDYDGLKVAMTSRAGQQQKQTQYEQLARAANWYDPKEMTQRRANAAKLAEPQRSRQQQICDIVEDWAKRDLPLLGYEGRLNVANTYAEPRRTQEINAVKAEVEAFFQRRGLNYQQNIDRAEAGAWPHYEERIAFTATTFRKHQQAFEKQAAALIDQRTPALINWLEAGLFIDTLNDFHGQSIDDGILFDEAVGEALFGLGSCRAGVAKIDAWVKQCKATVEANLLWRVVALNQHDARQELDKVLAEAKAHQEQQTLAASLTWVGYTAKSTKAIADTYKKAQGVLDGNTRAGAAGGASAFGAQLQPVRTFGTDKVAITAGDRVFRAFRIDKLGDYASEKIIQHVFSLRAFVSAKDSEDLIRMQAVADQIEREQLLRRLQASKAFMRLAPVPAAHARQVEELKAAWANFKAEDKGGAGARAIKDARLALVVMLIESVNFGKLAVECRTKGDAKSYFSLLTSGLSIASALFDVAAVGAKNLPSLGAESWTYQGLKGWGGVLSGGASLIVAWLDFADAGKSRSDGYSAISVLYFVKGIVGVATGSLTLAVSYTYAAGAIGRLTGRTIATVTAEGVVTVVGERAAAVLALRILGMALGGWATVGLFGLQVVIWIITPDALDKWIDHSAFGKKRDMGGYRDAKEQEKHLKGALIEMGLTQ